MTTRERDVIIQETLDRCIQVLKLKAGGYSTNDDVLHNFRQAAELQGCTVPQALLGMMTKHTVSVYDMVNSCERYTHAVWDEKIGDLINYLLLLRVTVKGCNLED